MEVVGFTPFENVAVCPMTPIYLMTIYITRDDVRDWMSHHPEYHKVNKMGVTEVRIFI